MKYTITQHIQGSIEGIISLDCYPGKHLIHGSWHFSITVGQMGLTASSLV